MSARRRRAKRRKQQSTGAGAAHHRAVLAVLECFRSPVSVMDAGLFVLRVHDGASRCDRRHRTFKGTRQELTSHISIKNFIEGGAMGPGSVNPNSQAGLNFILNESEQNNSANAPQGEPRTGSMAPVHDSSN